MHANLTPAPQHPTLRQRMVRIHGWLALVGGIALLIWGTSGLMHVTMSMFGPQPTRFLPPQQPIDLAGARPIGETLAAAGIDRAAAVRIVAGEGESLLQVTEEQDAPRRYFRPGDGTELAGHDPRHAAFLARYYTGQADTPIRSIERVTEFSDAYSAVNRLLPVYRVAFDRPDQLTAHVYTETNALAALTDRRQAFLQSAFQTLHSWKWVPERAEGLRIAIITLLLGTLIAMALTGIAMVLLIRRKTPAPGSLGWHRSAAYILWLPILTFSGSGLFHLYQNGFATRERTLTLSPPLDLAGFESGFPAEIAGGGLGTLSLVQGNDRQWRYRLTMAADAAAEPQGDGHMRHARFDGKPRTGEILYVDARTGQVERDWDREYALQLGERFTGVGREAIREASIVTRFGSGYDFRNKRLPVWRLDYGVPVNASIFVDTASGVLADRTSDSAKLELWSFGYLHKWNLLHPLGRTVQNMAIGATVMAILIVMGVIGLRLDLKRRRRRTRRRR